MTAFEKWSGFIMQLAEMYLEVSPQEKNRLKEKLTFIKKTNGAELFQAVYDTWWSLFLNGIHCYLMGEAEKWYIFHFLDMTRENPIEKELPKQALSKVTFVVPNDQKETVARFAFAWKLPESAYEIMGE